MWHTPNCVSDAAYDQAPLTQKWNSATLFYKTDKLVQGNSEKENIN